MARGDDALRKLQRMTLENNWPEVQRVAKKYHRHREIGEGLSNALESLVSLFLSKERYLGLVPFEYSVEKEDWRECLHLPEEILHETKSLLKSSLKHALKASKNGDADDQIVLIVNAYVNLFSEDAGKEESIDALVLGPIPDRYKPMRELFDFFYWLNVFVIGFRDAQRFDVIIQGYSDMTRAGVDLNNNVSQVLKSEIYKEIYLEALFRYSLFQVESGQYIQGANGLRRFLVETRRANKRNPARLVAIRSLLRLLEENFSDAAYRRDILEFPLEDTPYQPTCRAEEIALLGLLYAQGHLESLGELDKERVQTGWAHLKKIVASRLSRASAFESLEVLYEMGFDKLAVDAPFYDELLEIYQKLNKQWEAYAMAINIASKSLVAQRFLLKFPSQHLKLKSISKDVEIIEVIEDYKKLQDAKLVIEGECKSPIFESVRLYKLGKLQEAIVLLKKLFTKSPEDLRIRRLLFFMLSSQEGSEEFWEMFEEGEERDAFILEVAIEFAFREGYKKHLLNICSHLRSIVESETAPLSLTLSHSDPLKGALTDGDAISILGGSASLGEYSVGYQSDINLPGQTSTVLPCKYPTMEEWMTRYSLSSPSEYRLVKLYNYSPLSSEEWPPIKPKELLYIGKLVKDQLQPDYEILFAHALARLGQYDEALGVLLEAQKRDELEPGIVTRMALIYEMRGDRDAMRQCLERLTLLDLEEDGAFDSAEILQTRNLEEGIIKILIV